ncbi:MAG: family lipase [Rhizobacter sp.]|nr:family lipase [Rhizobacter sp.]
MTHAWNARRIARRHRKNLESQGTVASELPVLVTVRASRIGAGQAKLVRVVQSLARKGAQRHDVPVMADHAHAHVHWHKAQKTEKSRLSRSKSSARKWVLFGMGAMALAGGSGVVHAQSAVNTGQSVASADAASGKWKESFDAFEQADRLHPPAPGGVVFVGSSSIRFWDDLESYFGNLPVVKRGYGGSRLEDTNQNVARLVLPYQPRLVVVYAGDNDLEEGRTPQQVLESFRGVVDGVHAALPQTRVVFISIKPSPLRARLIEQTREANALVKNYTATSPDLDFVDVFSSMIGADGQPRRELFGPDSLHMNHTGYALWESAIVEALGSDLSATATTRLAATMPAARPSAQATTVAANLPLER